MACVPDADWAGEQNWPGIILPHFVFFFFLKWGDIYLEGSRLPTVGCLSADADNLKTKGPEGALKLPNDVSDHQG